MNKIRQTAVAGTFYTNNKKDLSLYLQELLDGSCGFLKKPQILIVPHAGYVYSGKTASVAYKILKKFNFKNIFLVGPSHYIAFDGFAFSDAKFWNTPLGDVKIAKNKIDNYIESKIDEKIFIHSAPHEDEHSLEVQVPFLQKIFDDFFLLPLVYGNGANPKKLAQIYEDFIDEDTLILVSTDLSHFYNQTKAKELDNWCTKSILDLDEENLNRCEACGKIGIEASIIYAKKHNLKSHLLDYSHSGEVSGDNNRVVGYGSYIFYKDN